MTPDERREAKAKAASERAGRRLSARGLAPAESEFVTRPAAAPADLAPPERGPSFWPAVGTPEPVPSVRDDSQERELRRYAQKTGMRIIEPPTPEDTEWVKRRVGGPQMGADALTRVQETASQIPEWLVEQYEGAKARKVAKGEGDMSFRRSLAEGGTTFSRLGSGLAATGIQGAYGLGELAATGRAPRLGGIAEGLAAGLGPGLAGSLAGMVKAPKSIINDPVETIADIGGVALPMMATTRVLKGITSMPRLARGAAAVEKALDTSVAGVAARGAVDSAKAGNWGAAALKALGVVPGAAVDVVGPGRYNLLNLPLEGVGAAARAVGKVYPKVGAYVLPKLARSAAGEAKMKALTETGAIKPPDPRRALEELTDLAANATPDEISAAAKARGLGQEDLAGAKKAIREDASKAREAKRREAFLVRRIGEEAAGVEKQLKALDAAGTAESVAQTASLRERLRMLADDAERVRSGDIAWPDDPNRLIAKEAQGEFRKVQAAARDRLPLAAQDDGLRYSPESVTKDESGRIKHGDAYADEMESTMDSPKTARQEIYDTKTGEVVARTPDLPEGAVRTAADEEAVREYLAAVHKHKPAVGGQYEVRVPMSKDGVSPASLYAAETEQAAIATRVAESVWRHGLSPEAALPIYKRMSHLKNWDKRFELPTAEKLLGKIRQAPLTPQEITVQKMRNPRWWERESKMLSGPETLQDRLRAQRAELDADIAMQRTNESATRQYAQFIVKAEDLTGNIEGQAQRLGERIRARNDEIAQYWYERGADMRRQLDDMQRTGNAGVRRVAELKQAAEEFDRLGDALRIASQDKDLVKRTMRPVNLAKIDPDSRALVLRWIDGATPPVKEAKAATTTKNLLPVEMAEDLELRMGVDGPLGWQALSRGISKDSIYPARMFKHLMRGMDTSQKWFTTTALYSALQFWQPTGLANTAGNAVFGLTAGLKYGLDSLPKHYYESVKTYFPIQRGAEGKGFAFSAAPPEDTILRFANGESISRGDLWERVGGGSFGGTEIAPKRTGPMGKYNEAAGKLYGFGAISDMPWKEAFVKAYLEKFPHKSLDEALRIAGEEFLNYSNNPYIVRWMSSSLTPFINFSYAAAPRLTRMMREFGGLFNLFNYMRDYADTAVAEDEGRDIQQMTESLPTDMQGKGIYGGDNKWNRGESRLSPASLLMEAPARIAKAPLSMTGGVAATTKVMGDLVAPQFGAASLIGDYLADREVRDPKTQRVVVNPNASGLAQAGQMAAGVLRPYFVPSTVSRAIEQWDAATGGKAETPRGYIEGSASWLANMLLSLGEEKVLPGMAQQKGWDRVVNRISNIKGVNTQLLNQINSGRGRFDLGVLMPSLESLPADARRKIGEAIQDYRLQYQGRPVYRYRGR